AAFRCAPIVCPVTVRTRAPERRAMSAVPSVEPASATMISSAHWTVSMADRIRGASLSVGITTEIGILGWIIRGARAFRGGTLMNRTGRARRSRSSLLPSGSRRPLARVRGAGAASRLYATRGPTLGVDASVLLSAAADHSTADHDTTANHAAVR